MGPGDAAEAARAIRERWTAAIEPTYDLAAAKEISVSAAGSARAGGEHGTEWGAVIHLLLQAAMVEPSADIRALAESALGEQGLDPGLAGDAAETVRAVMSSGVWKRAEGSERRLVEAPFQTLVRPEDGPPTVLRGVIDLVFREPGGWVVVDYKTDRQRGRPLEEIVERYRPQVLTYAGAWEKASGEPVREAGLYFTRTGRYVECRRA